MEQTPSSLVPRGARPEMLRLQPARNKTPRRGLILCSLLLCTFYYALPFIILPWGYTSYLRLDDLALIFCLLWWGLNRKRSKGPWRIHRLLALDKLVIAHLIYMSCYVVCMLIYGNANVYGIWQWVKYAQYFAVYFFVGHQTLDEAGLRRLCHIVLLGSLFVALYGFMQYYGFISPSYYRQMFEGRGQGWETLTSSGRFRFLVGPLSYNHAYAGAVLAAALASSWLLPAKGIGATLVIGASMTVAWALFLTGSRSPIYAVPCAVVITLMYGRIPKRWAGMLLTLGALTLVIMQVVPEASDRLLLDDGFEVSSAESRLRAWQVIGHYLLDNPTRIMQGIGLGRFGPVLGRLAGVDAAHNNYLHFLVELGLPFLLIFMAFHVKALRMALSLSRSEDPGTAYWGRLFIASELVWLLSALSQENFVPSAAMGSFLGYTMFFLGVTRSAFVLHTQTKSAQRRTNAHQRHLGESPS